MDFSRWAVFLILISTITGSFAQQPMKESDYAQLLSNGTDPAIIQQMMAGGTAPVFMQKLMQKLNQTNLSRADWSMNALIKNFTLVVVGSNADGTEMALLESAKAAYPELKNSTYIRDGDAKIADMGGDKYILIVLIGGPSQNRITKEITALGWLDDKEDALDQFTVQYGKNPKGSMVMVLSDKRGYANAARESVKYSPLSAFLPPEAVPAAATGISLLLLILLNLANIGGNVLGNRFQDLFGKKGKKVGEGAISFLGINLVEIGAIVAAAIVVGIAVCWQYFASGTDFLFWLFVSVFLGLLTGVFHDWVHKVFAMIFGLKVEYRLWPAGSILTLISSYLGNTFSIQGFLMDDIPESTPRWKVGLMRLAAPLFSNGMMVFFGLLNFVYPNVVFQIIVAQSGLLAIAEMLPLKSMDGEDIKKWNTFVWLFGFLLVACSYIFIVFVL